VVWIGVVEIFDFYPRYRKVAALKKRVHPSFRITDLNEAAGAADAARELNHEGSRRPVDW